MNLRKFKVEPKQLVLLVIVCFLAFPSLAEEVQPSPTTIVWKPLLGHWEASEFGGDGEIVLPKAWNTKDANNEIGELGITTLTAGDPLTGIRWNGPIPRDNYELRLKARRIEGFDFFAAITFPVADQQCSLVLGGWGGGVVGISSIDGHDASENQTSQFKQFNNGDWYDIRIQVNPEKIECWIDEKSWVDIEREGHTFDIRFELDPSLPLGIANYACVSEIRDVELRELPKHTNSDNE